MELPSVLLIEAIWNDEIHGDAQKGPLGGSAVVTEFFFFFFF